MTGFREQLEQMLPEVLIHTVTFDHQEGLIEVTYAELRDQADGVGMLKTLALERELFEQEIAELESDLRELIEEGVIAIRNEDARKKRIDRAMSKYRKDDDDDEEPDPD